MKAVITRAGKLASWLVVAIILLICIDVTFRYLLDATQVWIIELEWHMFGLLLLFCGGWTWLEDKHVRVDVFYNRFSSRLANRLDVTGHLLLAIPWLIVVVYTSIVYASYALEWNERSPDPGGLPARYILKFGITGGFILMLMAAVVLLRNSFSKKVEQDEP